MTPSKLCTSCLPCCQSFTVSDYINRTTVPTYLTTGPSTIAPYPRPSGQEEGDPVVDGSCPGGPGTDFPACGVWPVTDIPTTAGAYLLSNDQLFELSADPAVTTNICPGPGEKVSQTIKYHHGAKPLTFCADGCTAITTKYRTVAISIKGISRDNDEPCDHVTVIDETRTWTVNQTSGVITLTGCESNSRERNRIDGVWTDGLPYTVVYEDFCSFDPCDVDSLPSKYAFLKDLSYNIEQSISKSATELTWHILNAVDNFCDPPQEYLTDGGQLIMDEYDISVVLSDEYTSSEVLAYAKSAMSVWNFKNHALFPFSESVFRSVGVIAQYRELGATDPNNKLTGCTVDDYRHPTVGSGTEMDPYTAWEEMDWFDIRGYIWITDGHACAPANEIATELRLIYDGSIIGAPFTPGGIGVAAGLPDHNFSWTHITWGCYVPDGFPYTSEARFYGAYAGEDATGFDATDLKIPKSASLWTDQLSASFYYSGSWLMWDNTFASLTLQKQCEDAVKFDAFNLFGPYGYWRHEMDYKISTCITATTGTMAWAEGDTLTFADDDLCNFSRTDGFITAGDKVVLGNTATGSFKIFTLDAVSANNATLGAEDTDRRHVEDCYSMWTNASPAVATGDFGFIGKLFDWKSATVSFVPSSILGKIAATVAQDTDDLTKVKVTFPQKYTQVGDKIIFVQSDVADTSNNDNSGAGFTLTDVDDAFCKFTGTYDPATMKGMVKILGAPLAKWNSIKSRNTFYWSSCADDGAGGFLTPVNTDDRHHGVNTTLGSTPNNPNDTVASEWKTASYPAGGGFPFPTAASTTCGGKALVGVIQDMRHPLVQVPFCCVPTLEDGDPNPCAGFGVCLPRVEAFTQAQMDIWVLAGAPALPDGITLDVMTSPPIPAGDSCTAPHYLPGGMHAPWSQCTSPWIR